jgi:hypothetical protein
VDYRQPQISIKYSSQGGNGQRLIAFNGADGADGTEYRLEFTFFYLDRRSCENPANPLLSVS